MRRRSNAGNTLWLHQSGGLALSLCLNGAWAGLALAGILLVSFSSPASAQTPAQQTPAQHTPAQHIPAQQTPAAQTTAAKTPAAETPAQHTPAQHTPAQHTPAQLTMDSDPVPSPDAQATPPPATPAQGNAAQGNTAQGNAAAGPNQITGQHGQYTLRANAFEVHLNASVIDSSGQTVQNLPESAFHVYEDGVLQTIVGFRHEDTPVSLGILVDSSGSMYDKSQAVDTASLDMVRLSNPKDEAFLVDFSSQAYLDQDFTSDITKLQSGLSYVKASGGTALYDAVMESADHLAKYAKHPKQVILIITDGEDNASSTTLDDTIRRVQDLDGPSIYCIGLLFGDDHSEARHAQDVLRELAEETGGIAYFPHSLKDVDGIAREVAADIRSQYSIDYQSTKSPALGGYRTIHVEAKQKGYRGLQVRTRSGYYPRVAPATDTTAGSAGTTSARTTSAGATSAGTAAPAAAP